MRDGVAMGFEDLLGMLLDWVGLDFAAMSRRRMIFAVLIYCLFGLMLILGGIFFVTPAATNFETVVGVALLLFGVGVLARVAINLRAAQRKRDGTA